MRENFLSPMYLFEERKILEYSTLSNARLHNLTATMGARDASIQALLGIGMAFQFPACAYHREDEAGRALTPRHLRVSLWLLGRRTRA